MENEDNLRERKTRNIDELSSSPSKQHSNSNGTVEKVPLRKTQSAEVAGSNKCEAGGGGGCSVGQGRKGVAEQPLTFLVPKRPPSQSSTRSGSSQGNNGNDYEEVALEDDTYTMIFLAYVWTPAFFYGQAVWIFQVVIIFFAALAGQTWDENIPFGIHNAYMEVFVFQVLAVILWAFITVDDIPLAISLFRIPSNFKIVGGDSDTERSNDWQYCKLLISNFQRLIVGMLVNIANFVFILKSDTALTVLLRFAALKFITDWDNLAYKLAARGFITRGLQQHIRDMKGKKVQFRRQARQEIPFQVLSPLWFFVLMELLILFYLHFSDTFLQNATCKTVEVQFGNEMYKLPKGVNLTNELFEYNKKNDTGFILSNHFDMASPPDLHYSDFSGTYEATFELTKRQARPIYYERGFQKATTSGMFFYCEDITAWVFTIPALARADGDIVSERSKEQCGEGYGWLLQSPKTDEYFLDKVPNTGWTVWTGKSSRSEDVSITCLECRHDDECGIDTEVCDLDTKQCICDETHTGPFCNYEVPTTHLVLIRDDMYNHKFYNKAVTATTPQTPPQGPYSLLQNVSIYNRPVYFWENTNSSNFEVILYSGRRWYHIILKPNEFDRINIKDNNNDNNELSSSNTTTTTSFHAFHLYWGNILQQHTIFYSEETNAYVPTGRNLRWFHTSDSYPSTLDQSLSYDQIFERLAINCSESKHPCGLKGKCHDHVVLGYYGMYDTGVPVPCSEAMTSSPHFTCGGMCLCDDGYHGHFCELPPPPSAVVNQ